MKLNAPLFPIALCLMAGIGIGKNLESLTIVFAILLPLFQVTALARKWPKVQTAGILVCVVLFGMILSIGNPNRNDGRWIPKPIYQRVHNAKVHALEVREKLLKEQAFWNVDEEARGVIAAMTLGDKTTLSKELKGTYSRVGASHILALSGLHLMIIYSIVTLVIGWHRYHIVTQSITVLAIWAFALLAGLPTSVVRSAFMISIYALLSLGYRERMSVNTLAFVAVVLLVVNPLSLYDLGFQLSFTAVLSILLVHPLINGLIAADVQQRHRWQSTAWGLVTVSVAAQIGTAPLVAYHFGRFSTWFLLSNFIVIPLAWLILCFTLLCLAFSWWSWAAGTLTVLLVWLTSAMNHALGWVAQLPLSSIEGIRLSAIQLLLIYIIIGCCYVALSIRFPAARRSG